MADISRQYDSNPAHRQFERSSGISPKTFNDSKIRRAIGLFLAAIGRIILRRHP